MRPKYMSEIWKIINWKEVEARYENALKKWKWKIYILKIYLIHYYLQYNNYVTYYYSMHIIVTLSYNEIYEISPKILIFEYF